VPHGYFRGYQIRDSDKKFFSVPIVIWWGRKDAYTEVVPFVFAFPAVTVKVENREGFSSGNCNGYPASPVLLRDLATYALAHDVV
jgi:hypothetical protein